MYDDSTLTLGYELEVFYVNADYEWRHSAVDSKRSIPPLDLPTDLGNKVIFIDLNNTQFKFYFALSYQKRAT